MPSARENCPTANVVLEEKSERRKKKEERNKRTRTLAPRRRGEGKIRKDTKESNKASRRAQRAEVIKEKK